MVKSKFTSKFKGMAYGVFGLSFVLSFVLFYIASPNKIEPEPWSDPHSILVIFASLVILIFGCIPLLKMKTIRIEKQRIIFQNYVFTSRIKEVDFRDYDCFKTVQEESENGEFEAVWLIKNERLIHSFSTFQYSNYKELVAALKLKNDGPLDISPLKQLRCKFGAKI